MKRFIFILLLSVLGTAWSKEPELYCEKNWGERTWQGMTFHRYHLRANHFPPDKKYRLVVESFDGMRTETFDYISNKKGHLILVPPDEDYKDEIFAICPAKRGEKLTFWMKSEEDAFSTQLIPFPLEMHSKEGAKLHLELQGQKGEKFLFIAEDLEANEEIELFLAIEGKQSLLCCEKTSSDGELNKMIDLPSDAHGGEATLILKRQQEEVVFPFQWGTPALKIVGACCFEIK